MPDQIRVMSYAPSATATAPARTSTTPKAPCAKCATVKHLVGKGWPEHLAKEFANLTPVQRQSILDEAAGRRAATARTAASSDGRVLAATGFAGEARQRHLNTNGVPFAPAITASTLREPVQDKATSTRQLNSFGVPKPPSLFEALKSRVFYGRPNDGRGGR